MPTCSNYYLHTTPNSHDTRLAASGSAFVRACRDLKEWLMFKGTVYLFTHAMPCWSFPWEAFRIYICVYTSPFPPLL